MHAVIYTTAYKPNPLARTMKILLSALLSTQLKRRTEFSSFETKKIYLVKNQEYKPCLKTPFSLPQFFPHFFPLSQTHSTGLAGKNLDIFCLLKEKLDAQGAKNVQIFSGNVC
jgi:hypothetical protein